MKLIRSLFSFYFFVYRRLYCSRIDCFSVDSWELSYGLGLRVGLGVVFMAVYLFLMLLCLCPIMLDYCCII